MALVTAAPRLRRHLHAVLRTALPVRPPHEHAGPSDQRAASAGTSSPATSNSAAQGMGDAAADRPRRPLRHRRRLHAGRSTSCGKASWEDGAVLRDRAVGPLRRSRPHPSHRARRAVLPASTRSICASRRRNARRCCIRPAHPTRGRQFAARHAECVFINGPSKQVIGADRRRHAPPRRRGRPRPGRTRDLHHDDRDHRHHDAQARSDKLRDYRATSARKARWR